MREFEIAPLTDADAAEWLRMRQALWPDCTSERHVLEQQILTNDKDALVLIARHGTTPCGFIEVSIRRDHVEGTAASPVPYIEGWFVDSAARGQKIGQTLLCAAEEWARGRGFRELASDAELENHHAIAAHHALGFSEAGRNVCFIKKL